jgi:uncharacterized membrane protein YcaP (DUF421 family)
MTNCFSAVIAVGLMHRLVALLKQRFPRIGAIVDGTPLVLLKNGEWQTEVMHKMRIQDDDVMAAARAKGVTTLQGVKYAILERNGGISIIKGE